MTILEICANSLASALAAQAGGADRIELCSNLEQGGITPSYGLIQHVLTRLSIPVHVLIRPRPGNFVYDADYLAIMHADVRACRALGVQGIAVGVLDAEGNVDREACGELVRLAREEGDGEGRPAMSVTFHRAFDDCVDQVRALEDVVALRFDRVLTSGGKDRALDGELRLRRLVTRAGERVVVMPGAGVTVENIRDIYDRTDAREFHASATKTVDQAGEEFGHSRFAVTVKRTDAGIVRGLRDALTKAEHEKPNLHAGSLSRNKEGAAC